MNPSLRLTEDYISRRLKEAYQPGVFATSDGNVEMFPGEQLKCAAVLLPLVWWDDEWHLVFTRRTETVETHKGQVSFPGGGCDEDESIPEQTALREAEEEIGLKPGDVHLLGRLNEVVTITRYRVTPVAGVMPWPYPVSPERAEVERVFTIPLLWLADSDHWNEASVTPVRNMPPFRMITYNQYDGETLWGVSAKIAHNFLAVLGVLDQKGKTDLRLE